MRISKVFKRVFAVCWLLAIFPLFVYVACRYIDEYQMYNIGHPFLGALIIVSIVLVVAVIGSAPLFKAYRPKYKQHDKEQNYPNKKE